MPNYQYKHLLQLKSMTQIIKRNKTATKYFPYKKRKNFVKEHHIEIVMDTIQHKETLSLR